MIYWDYTDTTCIENYSFVKDWWFLYSVTTEYIYNSCLRTEKYIDSTNINTIFILTMFFIFLCFLLILFNILLNKIFPSDEKLTKSN
jgi:hypothetical protein